MNERIKELWNYAADTTKDDSWESQSAFIEEFAELIVDNAVECVRDVLRDPDSTLNYNDAGKIQARIREFFGVEL